MFITYKKIQDLSIQQIYTHYFPLTQIHNGRVQHGVLLKIILNSGEQGYSSFYPLPLLKDDCLDYHLQFLKHKVATPLLEHSLSIAQKDAKARSQKINLLQDLIPIKNHNLVLDIFSLKNLDELSSSIIKIKMGEDLNAETKKLKDVIRNTKKTFKLRLDFNHKLSSSLWKEWEKQNQAFIPIIDFIEDPFIGCSRYTSRFPLAFDFEQTHFYPIRIVKPSRLALDSLLKNVSRGEVKRVIFTHSLNHPLEARWSRVAANQFYKVHSSKQEACGLDYNFSLFEKNEFTGAHSEGIGLGYNQVLENLKWIRLV